MYNLAASMGDTEKANALAYKLNLGSKGTTWDLLRGAAKETTEPLKFFGGKEIKATTAVNALKFFTSAYEAEKEVLPFVIGGAGAASILGRSATGLKILGGVEKVSKPFNFAVVPFGIGGGATTGYQTYKQTGDLGFSLSAGLGSSVGFFGAAYAKPIVKLAGKPVKNIVEGIKDVILLEKSGNIRGIGGGRLGKKGSTQVTTQTNDSAYEEVLDASGNVIGFRRKILRGEATAAFKGLTRSEQIDILEKGFRGRKYLDDAAMIQDLNRAKAFLKSTGLTDAQIEDRLLSLTARLKGLGMEAELKIRERLQA